MKDKIEFAEFLEIEKKLEIIVGDVTNVEDIPKSTKLVKLTVDFGNSDIRTVVTNIKQELNVPSQMVGRKFLFITNLKPAIIMGIESNAMILPGEINDGSTTMGIVSPRGGIKIL